MTKEITIHNLSEIQSAAQSFLAQTAGHSLIAFYAPMGAGKTTFTTAICHQLGVRDDAVSSPTFSIVNEYKRDDGQSMYHFDFYRLDDIEEALEIGTEDYFDSGALCLIEWPERVEDLLPGDTVDVYIKVDENDNSRIISFE